MTFGWHKFSRALMPSESQNNATTWKTKGHKIQLIYKGIKTITDFGVSIFEGWHNKKMLPYRNGPYSASG